MRRLAVLAAGLAMVATLGVTGVSGAAASVPALHVKPGGVWTELNKQGGCEVQTFATGGTWTADIGGDAGTYTGGGKTLLETWTAGQDATLTFTAKYSRSKKKYVGTFGGGFDQGDTGYLVKGVVSEWNGYSC